AVLVALVRETHSAQRIGHDRSQPGPMVGWAFAFSIHPALARARGASTRGRDVRTQMRRLRFLHRHDAALRDPAGPRSHMAASAAGPQNEVEPHPAGVQERPCRPGTEDTARGSQPLSAATSTTCVGAPVGDPPFRSWASWTSYGREERPDSLLATNSGR